MRIIKRPQVLFVLLVTWVLVGWNKRVQASLGLDALPQGGGLGSWDILGLVDLSEMLSVLLLDVFVSGGACAASQDVVVFEAVAHDSVLSLRVEDLAR